MKYSMADDSHYSQDLMNRKAIAATTAVAVIVLIAVSAAVLVAVVGAVAWAVWLLGTVLRVDSAPTEFSTLASSAPLATEPDLALGDVVDKATAPNEDRDDPKRCRTSCGLVANVEAMTGEQAVVAASAGAPPRSP